jgi:hypothetical protein
MLCERTERRYTGGMVKSSLRPRLALALVLPFLLAACNTTQVGIDPARGVGRAYPGPIDKPRLLVTPLDMKEETWKQTSVYYAVPDVGLPSQIRASVVKCARATNLFKEVVPVDFDADELDKRKDDLKPGDQLLALTMRTFKVSGGLTPGGMALCAVTLGIAPLISLTGVPTLSYHQESEWQLQYTLIDAMTKQEKLKWDSGVLRSEDSSFTASWSNTPLYMNQMFERNQSRMLTAFAASFEPLAPEQRLRVDYPYEVAAPSVVIKISVADDPSLRYLTIGVNDKELVRQDLKALPSLVVPMAVELAKGSNTVAIVATDSGKQPMSKVTVVITRHR